MIFILICKHEMCKYMMMMIYRPKTLHKIQFLMNLENIISHHDYKIDMIFCDFNINCHNESDSEQLRQIMDNFGYIQIVKNATFVLAGSFIRSCVCQIRSFKCTFE